MIPAAWAQRELIRLAAIAQARRGELIAIVLPSPEALSVAYVSTISVVALPAPTTVASAAVGSLITRTCTCTSAVETSVA